ncbi:glycoside hydrolase [Leucogyrophana mollusca]|uniref:Glycoside hydrolase n=1 Tax=Leucogyrophana mollusca TaxID=85980 RepID=A0ACB8BCA1_9AGAM|nr:glycoside hydrolase [Leucogyrophana mollusca]
MALPLALAAPTCSLKNGSGGSTVATTGSSSTNTTGSGTTTGGGNGTTSGGSDTVALAWFADWHPDYTVANISWSKYTAMTYFAVATTNDPSTLDFGGEESGLDTFIAAAHSNNVKALLTIGGWTGSQYFSTSVGSSANRTTFANTIRDLAFSKGLDGIDFDWEYPGKQGVGCNTISPDDSANFLSFLQELRSSASNITLSAAVSLTPFADTNGQPMTNVSGFADVLDYIEIMNYDVWGSYSASVGPNAPLNDTCAPASDQAGSAVSAVDAWTKAGFPANQIVLGVASYGHSYFVSNANATGSSSTDATSGALVAFPGFSAAQQPMGDSWDSTGGLDQCGVYQGPSGDFNFWGMIDAGFLNTDGSVASGMESRYDECSQTPYVYNPTSQIMISYDNATSFAAKGSYITQAGLRGFAMYEAGGDYNNILIDSINQAVGRN